MFDCVLRYCVAAASLSNGMDIYEMGSVSVVSIMGLVLMITQSFTVTFFSNTLWGNLLKVLKPIIKLNTCLRHIIILRGKLTRKGIQQKHCYNVICLI